MRKVVITGMGIVSPIGNCLQENLQSLLDGRGGIAPISAFDTSECKIKVAGELKNFRLEDYISPKDVKRLDRFVSLALVASKEAVDMSGLAEYGEWNKKRTGTIIATGIGGLGSIEQQYDKLLLKGMKGISPFFVPGAISNMAAARISIEYGLKGSSCCLNTACAGGTNAIGESMRMIRDGYQDVMICGGSESCISLFGTGSFAALNALSAAEDPNRASIPFDAERNGFVMGEGAGILVLEELEHAKRRNAVILAEVSGYGVNCDAYHVTAPLPDGTGAAECMKMALDDAGIGPECIDYINAHGTSTKLNDSGETKAVKIALGDRAKDVLMSSTKSMTGHLLGASGAVEAIFTTLAVKENYAPPTINYRVKDEECDLNYVPNEGVHTEIKYAMSNSLGFGGHNASIIIKKCDSV